MTNNTYDNNRQHQDFRRQARKYPGFILKVFNRKTGIGIGPLGNISSNGFMVYSRELYLPGNNIEFAMILPSKLNGKSNICFTGSCVWCREYPGNEYHEAGFEIVSIDEESMQVLSILMSSLS